MIGRIGKWGFISLLFIYLYLPIVVLVVNSFNSTKSGIRWGEFTTKWYSAMWNNSGLMDAAMNSLLVATVAATAATVIGTLAAVALHRYRFRGKGALNGMLFVVMASPDIVMAVSLLALFVTIGVQLGFWSLLIAHITFCLPFVVVSVYSRLSGFDPFLIEAARDLGASQWRTFIKIIVPMAFPAVAAGWLLSFTLSLDDVIISSFVTGPSFEILPLKVFSMVKVGVKPSVNALAAVMLLLSLIMVAISQFLLKQKPSA
ncbi:spermidine/putrescine ABC transporter permease PotC [Ferrimonas lipolytica]|uniref:Spermidine/putrescine transport system permease protein PotC n=1 Tax=Ferrimonas lipolytica TaxID=2724191 RepID=A0A6H1UC00_9GAMM|nr:spermidine/putrescine ABC transporter permease PotC [Ferrimonas lipolytica]QIZ76595.1 spermidine/putrescine ABC transporter permease PotC [Ferrimonas lipolytica]